MNKKTSAPTFTKEQFLNAKDPIGNVDALYAICLWFKFKFWTRK